MNLKIFTSNTNNSAIHLAIKDLGNNISDNDNNIVIVPDRFSLDTEKEIYTTLGIEGSTNIDVVSFTRLAVKTIGAKIKKSLSKEGTILLLKKVIEKNVQNLCHYKAITQSPRFAKEMFIAIASLKKSGITVEDINLSREKMDKRTSNKLGDVALLYQEYDKELALNYSDTLTRLDTLIEEIPNNDKIKSSNVYILGYNFFDAKQLSIISAIIKWSKSCNISICQPKHNRAVGDLCNSETLKSLANSLGAKTTIIEGTKVLSAPYDIICSSLFTYEKPTIKARAKDKLKIFAELNPYDEVKAIGKEITRLIREKKYRYKDFALICSSESNKMVIKDIFSRYDIPNYIDMKYPIVNDVISRFILLSIESVTSNLKQKSVLALAKQPLMNLAWENVLLFEDYCLKYNINHSYFNSPFCLGTEEEREIPEKIRRIILSKLKFLTEEKRTFSHISEMVLNYLEFCDIESLHQAYLENSSLDSASANASSQVYQAIKDVLMEGSEILSDSTCTLKDFYSLFYSSLSNLNISVIPQFIDAVFVGEIEDSRYTDVKVLFITGVNQGLFPQVASYQSIINYYDVDSLKRQGLQLYPTPMDKMYQTQFLILDLLTKASDCTYLSFSHFDLSGNQLCKGDIIKEIEKLCDATPFSLSEKFRLEAVDNQSKFINFAVNTKNLFYEYLDLKKTISPHSPFLYACREHLEKSGYKERLAKIEQEKPGMLSNPLDFFFRKEGRYHTTKVSQLETYFNCPYKHYLSYGLRLRKKEKGDFEAIDIGNIIHNILEMYFLENKANIKTMTDEQIKKQSLIAIDKVLDGDDVKAKLNKANGKRLSRLIITECKAALFKLSKNIQLGSYTPEFIELEFGGSNAKFEGIKILDEEDEFLLKGKIDRVDIYKKNVIIIDYKTGNVDKSSDFDKIYLGLKIQLYIYLAAFLESGYKARGVFYLPIALNYNKDDKYYDFRLNGHFDASKEGIEMIDKEILNEANATAKAIESDIVNFSIKAKDNQINITKNKKFGLEQDDFGAISDYALKVTKKAIGEIKSGYIEKKPYESSCKYCDYLIICGGVDEENERKEIKSITKENLIGSKSNG